MIRIHHKGKVIECSSPAEATELLRRLDAEDRRLPLFKTLDAITQSFGGHPNPWTARLFWQFIDSLGEPQKHMLTLLVRDRKMTDAALRKAGRVETNQQLAGILSGISKQAAALNIPARDVYTIENESRSGETTKSYAIALSFLRIATEMNWPDEP